jgi:hypothetical protein
MTTSTGTLFLTPEPLLRRAPDDLFPVRIEESQGRRAVIAKDQFGSVFPVTAGQDEARFLGREESHPQADLKILAAKEQERVTEESRALLTPEDEAWTVTPHAQDGLRLLVLVKEDQLYLPEGQSF